MSSSFLQTAERLTPSSKSLSEVFEAQIAFFQLIDDSFEFFSDSSNDGIAYSVTAAACGSSSWR